MRVIPEHWRNRRSAGRLAEPEPYALVVGALNPAAELGVVVNFAHCLAAELEIVASDASRSSMGEEHLEVVLPRRRRECRYRGSTCAPVRAPRHQKPSNRTGSRRTRAPYRRRGPPIRCMQDRQPCSLLLRPWKPFLRTCSQGRLVRTSNGVASVPRGPRSGNYWALRRACHPGATKARERRAFE